MRACFLEEARAERRRAGSMVGGCVELDSESEPEDEPDMWDEFGGLFSSRVARIDGLGLPRLGGDRRFVEESRRGVVSVSEPLSFRLKERPGGTGEPFPEQMRPLDRKPA